MNGRNDHAIPIGSFGHALALTKLVELLLAEVVNMDGANGGSPSDRLMALRATATGKLRALDFGDTPAADAQKIREDAEQTLRAMFSTIHFVARE